jgi:hypothetical protein
VLGTLPPKCIFNYFWTGLDRKSTHAICSEIGSTAPHIQAYPMSSDRHVPYRIRCRFGWLKEIVYYSWTHFRESRICRLAQIICVSAEAYTARIMRKAQSSTFETATVVLHRQNISTHDGSSHKKNGSTYKGSVDQIPIFSLGPISAPACYGPRR